MRTFPIIIAYDITIHKIGCALLQAAMGGTINPFDLQRFGVENWSTAPTPDMHLYILRNEVELDFAIKVCIDNNL